MRKLLPILLLLLVYSCNNKPSAKKTFSTVDNPDKFFEIRYEYLLNNKKVIGLSQVASNVEYIQLETNNDCLLRRDANYFFTDSLILISNRDHVLKFSRDGKFLKKIGNPGKGPGEINRIKTMSVSPNKKWLVVQNSGDNKLLYFSFTGELVKTVTTPYIQYLKVMNDGNYIAYENGSFGREKYTFRLTNELGDTISKIDNYNTWENTSNVSLHMVFSPFEPFYYYRNMNFFKDMYNDTVYFVNSDKIKPGYYINLGKYRLPKELRPERLGPEKVQLFNDKADNYYYGNVFEASNQIFLASLTYGKADPKYLLFDKKNHTGNLLINDISKSTGFINDWDGGMDFWPIASINDNQVFMPINIMTFQKELEKNKSTEKSVKFPEKKNQLEKMISELDISNNPIIMVVTLKNKKGLLMK